MKVNRNGIQSNTLHGVDAGWYDEWNEPWDGDSYSFEKGAEYRMTEKGLELLKPSKDAQLKEENQIKTDEENPLKDLKEERMEMEAEKGNPKVTVNTERAKNALVQKTSQILDFHWVLDRFSY